MVFGGGQTRGVEGFARPRSGSGTMSSFHGCSLGSGSIWLKPPWLAEWMAGCMDDKCHEMYMKCTILRDRKALTTPKKVEADLCEM